MRTPAQRRPLSTIGLLVTLVIGLAVLLTLGMLPTAVVADDVATAVDEQVLDFPPLPDDLDELAERSVVVDRNGEEVAVLRAENRIAIEYAELPTHLIDAVVATEDNQFWEHGGVNWRGVARAALGNMQAGEITSGGSGITQQLVKNLVVGSDQTYVRKLQEATYATELERRWSKEQILEAYLNEVYLAGGTYGMGAAAEYYFGRDVGELTLAQSALLAGVIRTPERNDPVDHPERALARRDVVLGQMRNLGLITAAQADEAMAEPLVLDLHPIPEPRMPFLAAYVRQVLDNEPGLGANVEERRRAYERGGLVIRTTLDTRLQEAAEATIARHVEQVTGPTDPIGALTAVDPRTGEVLAVAAGPQTFGSDEGETQVNPAVPGHGGGGRQAGSAFKAFALVAALEEGIPPTYRTDTPSPYEPTRECADLDWTPSNYSDSGGGMLDMADATATSSNVYFAELVDRTGPEKLAEVAHRMGITSDLTANCTLVLGTSDVFPLEMASAFGTLAADGRSCPPFTVAEVRDRDGRVIAQGGGSCEQAVDPTVARRATQLLRGPVERGTASANGQIGRPAAGKTGTTQNYTDAWFVGYIPQLSVATWMGADTPTPVRDAACGGPVTGGCLPTRMWRDFMKTAVATLELGVQDFPAPPDLPTRVIPDVLGDEGERAQRILEREGFVVEREAVPDWREEGTVVASGPDPGDRAARGSVVTVRVSDGTADPPEVPDVTGRSRESAEEVLAGLGLRARVRTVAVTDPDDEGRVIHQTPAAGSEGVSRLGRGVTVRLEIGREPRPGEAPRAPSPPATAARASSEVPVTTRGREAEAGRAEEPEAPTDASASASDT